MMKENKNEKMLHCISKINLEVLLVASKNCSFVGEGQRPLNRVDCESRLIACRTHLAKLFLESFRAVLLDDVRFAENVDLALLEDLVLENAFVEAAFAVGAVDNN